VLITACSPSGATTSTTAGTTTAAASTTATTVQPSTSTSLPPGTEELPEALREDVARLIGVTQELRGLEFVTQPTITVVTDEELAARVRTQILEDYVDADVDEALYKLLGLVDPAFDLRQTVSDLYGEQVAGFYDGETEELVVPARDNEFTILQEVTLVHELTHALTDQVLDFHPRFTALHDQDRFDEASAFQALIEGDASLTEILFVEQMTPDEQRQFLDEAFDIDTSLPPGVPQFIEDSLVFPYETGFGFVAGIHGDGGFTSVDDAYASPPLSTEQVLDPSAYLEDLPQPVELPTGLLEGYEISYGSTWGELGFRLIFDQELGGQDDAAEGWGGDAYDLYFNGTDVAMILLYEGDRESDADEMYGALREYVTEAMDTGEPTPDGGGFSFSGNDYAFTALSGSRVAWVIAGDPVVGATVRSWLTDF
jgi:hypothetical protein